MFKLLVNLGCLLAAIRHGSTMTSAAIMKQVSKKRATRDAFPPSFLLFLSVKRVKAETASKIREEMQKKNDQLMKEKEKSYEERMKKLTEKMEKEQAQMRAEQQRIMEHKLQVC